MNDIIFGTSREMDFDEINSVEISIPAKRFCTVMKMNVISDVIPKLSSADITFGSNLIGRVDIDPTSADILKASASSATISLSGISSTNYFSTLPCSLKNGDVISASFKFNGKEASASYIVPVDTEIASGKTFEFDLSPNMRTTFNNPVWTEGSKADPTVWRDGDTFYSAATGIGTLLKSTDLVNWTSISGPLSSTEKNKVKDKYGSDYWAPDVIKLNGKWCMYLTVRRSSSDSGICLFESSSPAGPFTYVSRVTDGNETGIKDSIDAEVVEDPTTGKLWLFFGSTGKMHRVELAEDGTKVADGAKYVHVAGLDSSQNSSRSKVFEGCYLHFRDGYWYLFASAGLYSNSTYKVVVGRSSTLEGTFTDKQGRKMTEGYAETFLKSDNGDAFFGPGHNAEIFTDTTGQDYILYHCHNASVNGGSANRWLMLQRVYWASDGWPYVEGGKPAATDITPVF